MSKKQSIQNTKDAILESALELFALAGYDATSTRAIAQKSGANLSAISYHFGGKEGLYKAVFARCFSFVEDILDTAPNAPLQRITHYTTKMSELHQNNPFMARLFMANVLNPKPFMMEFIAQYQAQMRKFLFDILDLGVKQGVFRADIDLTSTAIALLGIVNFYFFIHSSKILPKDFANLANTYTQNALDIFLNGISVQCRGG